MPLADLQFPFQLCSPFFAATVEGSGISALAALMLALGIGASVAMFTVVDHVLQRPRAANVNPMLALRAQ